MSIRTGRLAAKEHTWTDSTYRAALDIVQPLERDEPYEGTQLERVYFAHTPANKLVKIGVSTNVDQRLARLKSENRCPDLTLIGTLKGGLHTEEAIHHKLNHWRITGEWFNEHALPEITELLEFPSELAA